MKHAIIIGAVLGVGLVAGGCKSKSEDAKGEAPAGAAKVEPAQPEAAQPEAAKPEPAQPEAPKAAPLSDEQCKDVVLAIVACRSSGDDSANVGFDDWLLERFYGGTGIALLDPLQDEMDEWKKDPAKPCASWRGWRKPEPFPDGAAVHAAAKAGDCAAMRTAIDAAGGIPVAPDEP